MFVKLYLLGFVTFASVVFQGSISNAQSLDLTCYNRIGGSWNFGTAPSACNVSPTGGTSALATQFSPVIFSDARTTTQGRKEYLSAMFPVLRELGTYYIKRRNPSAGDAEIAGFLAGLYTLAEQETLWSHYRKGTDGILRYMRGDGLHGHGFMQVDDRSHVAALKQGKGVDLAYNVIYGLDIFYAAWIQSASSRCISSPSNYHDRARASWAAYNGGPGAICRWKSNGKTDRDFNTRYDRKAWMAFVADPHAPSSLNVKCLAEGKRPCALGSSGSPIRVTVASVLANSIAPATPHSSVEVGQETYALSPQKNYLVLRTCSSVHCGRTGTVLHGTQKDQVVLTGQRKDGWVEIKLVNREGNGWMPQGLLAEL